MPTVKRHAVRDGTVPGRVARVVGLVVLDLVEPAGVGPGKVEAVELGLAAGVRVAHPPEPLRSLRAVLKPQIGHNIGFQAPISARSAWAPSRTRHRARDRWRGAENCT